MMKVRLFAALAVLIAGLVSPATVFAGDWCVFDDGTHVHVACSDYTPEQYKNRHSHDDGGGHSDGDGSDGHHQEADCIVTHAATPAQLCPLEGTNSFQYYHIGADGSSAAGPIITRPSAGSPAVQLFSGTNPMTGKSVTVEYKTDGSSRLQVSTYYPDTEYDTDKPYVFSVSDNNVVTHISW